MIKFLLFFVGTIVFSSVVGYITLKNIVIEHTKDHLIDVIKLVEMELPNEKNLDFYVKKLHKNTHLRFTIIDNNGVVIAESNTDKHKMENHGNRYEIIKANKEKFSYISRYSHTLGVDLLYVAKKVSLHGKKVYIRVAMSLSKIMENFYDLWSKLAIIFIIILMIAFYASRRMSQRIVYDIEQITNYLNELSNKNYKATIKTKYFYEFLQISQRLKNLAKKLQNREKQKRKYTAKLRLMNKQRNDILSAISHEFKNPVASIMGYAQTLEEEPDIDIKIRKKFLSKISSNGEKISQMLDRLALSVKFDNNDLDINPSEFDLQLLCEEVVSNIRLKYKDRYIYLHTSKYIINADKTMIELVLINLLDNALKYSENDVEVILENDKLSVVDMGIGIKEEHLDKVTSKFYRVNKNSWDNSMGIGLAMVSYILKAHHSSLEIKSTYAKGSSFSFSLKEMSKS